MLYYEKPGMSELNYGGEASAVQTRWMHSIYGSLCEQHAACSNRENGLCNNKNNINEAAVWGSLWLSRLAVIVYFRGHLKWVSLYTRASLEVIQYLQKTANLEKEPNWQLQSIRNRKWKVLLTMSASEKWCLLKVKGKTLTFSDDFTVT